MNNEIIVDFSNNESVLFQTISQAIALIRIASNVGVFAKGIHCSDTGDTQLLQDYLEGLNKSINT